MDKPVLAYLGAGQFYLMAHFEFGGHVVPAGFVTDLDSVKRWPVIYWLLKGRSVEAAIVHDYLYYEGAGKKLADSEFLRLMELEGVSARYRKFIYFGVKFFGGSRYNELKKENQFLV